MTRDFTDEILGIILSSENDAKKKEQLLQYHEYDIAACIPKLDYESRIKLYRILGDEVTSEVFSYLDDVSEYVAELDKEKAADIIEKMDADDAVDVLDELDDSNRENIINLMEPEARSDIELITNYSDEEIGSKITTNFITISTTMDVKQAMKSVVSQASENDNVTSIYCLDKDNKYDGELDLRDLIIARESEPLSKYIKTNYPYFMATEIISDVITKMKDYALDSIPVLNNNMEVIGVITSSDVVETVDEEMGEDYAKLAGLTSEEDLDEPVKKSIAKRLPWLVILLFLGLCVSSLISQFESVVIVLPMIVFFQSLILDMAGNTGTQSLAVTIRILSNEERSKKTLIHTVLKEIRIGFFNGLILSVITFALVFLFLFVTKQSIRTSTDGFSIYEALQASGIVSISLLVSITICAFIGSTIPMLFMKMHIDPAVASGPFITTLNDLVAIIIYYGLAYILFIAI